MKFCQTHWIALQAAVQDQGLSKFIAKSGPEVASKIEQELKNQETSKTTFDPLLGAHNTIVLRALDVVGIDLLIDHEDGTQKCPICFLQTVHNTHCKIKGCLFSYEPWIDFAARDMRKEAIRLGLLAEL